MEAMLEIGSVENREDQVEDPFEEALLARGSTMVMERETEWLVR